MSSTEKRTIKINPELFKVSEKNTSRKKKQGGEINIKVKTSPKPRHNKTLRRSVMKMIREKQMEEYKKLFDEKADKDNHKKSLSSSDSNDRSEFNKDFNSSCDFFGELLEKTEENIKHNHSFKRYPNESPQSLLFHPMSENVSMVFPEVSNEIVPQDQVPLHIHRPSIPHLPVPPSFSPKFGCLKNGKLPTRRSWLNSTMKNTPYQVIAPSTTPTQPIQTNPSMSSPYAAPSLSVQPQPSIDNKYFESAVQGRSPFNSLTKDIKKDLSEKRQKFEKGQSIHGGFKNKLKYLKRRKIYKRTFKIGRSPIAPTVSVLVSNKTIRNRISTEAQLLKQTPIQDVKKYLIKKGFIKVGTIAPNDVLRKMYETVHLICGEVDNHNPENLLFNFIHDSDK